MNDEELREACVLAGLRMETSETVRIDDNRQPLTLHILSPLLPPYLASLLVARIWATRHHEGKTEIDRYLDSFDTNDCAEFFASDTQRIRAAVKVLKP